MGGITMTGTGKAGTAGQQRAVFAVDEDAALAALEEAWAEGGYHAFSVGDGIWSTISSAGQMLTGSTPDELDRTIRAHWRAMQWRAACMHWHPRRRRCGRAGSAG
jgi:hypothetical protein